MSEVPVYVSPAVAAVRSLWERSGALSGPVIAEQLSAFADAVCAAHAACDRGAETLVANWLDAPRWRSEPSGAAETLSPAGPLSWSDARLIAARDHGFTSFSHVTGQCDPIFERAVDAVVLGRLDELDRLLTDRPDLIGRRSGYGHRATLLHYVAANGVEIRRQAVPANAPEITARLLEAGAEAGATLRAYGGAHDTLAMLRSSAHPQAAGHASSLARRLSS